MEITNAADTIINDHNIDDTPQEQMECAIEVLATGNIDSPKTMIDDSLSSKLKQSVPPARVIEDHQKKLEIKMDQLLQH